jgi:phosphatidylserine decarboxylase
MMMDRIFALAQYIVPHHALSRLVGRLAEARWPVLKNALIGLFIRVYKVDMTEAAAPCPRDYATFNEFFTRPLKPDRRPIAAAPESVISPADGVISQIGAITGDTLIQAKGRDFCLTDLLGASPARAAPFRSGAFATIYLSPRDYHRFHMPLAGALREMVYVPGRLFSVNDATARHIPGLFARNERIVALFDTAAGPMALVFVGAMIVASIETVWAGVITPPHGRPAVTLYDPPLTLEKGAEAGRFRLGSTVIALFGPDAVAWAPERVAHSPVRMGEALGTLQPSGAQTVRDCE